jgi:hypothetical protein
MKKHEKEVVFAIITLVATIVLVLIVRALISGKLFTP